MSIISPAAVIQQRVSAVLESTPGTTPASPAYNILPINKGFQLKVGKAFEESKLIRSDREPGAIVGGVSTIDGRIPMSFVKEAGLRMMMESALGGTFTVVALTVSVSWDNTDKSFNRAAGSFLTDPIATRLRVGDTVFPTGTVSNQSTLNMAGGLSSSATTVTVTSGTPFATSGVVKIDSEIIKYTGKSGNDLTGCTRGWAGTTAASHSNGAVVSPGLTITSVAAAKVIASASNIQTEVAVSSTLTANTKILVPGLVRKYYTVEQYFQDIAAFRLFTGVEANTMQIRVPTSGPVDVEFGVLGLNYGTTQAASSTYTALAGNTPMAGSQPGSSLLVDGASFNSCIESIDINLNNERAARTGVGNQFPCFIGEGTRRMNVNFNYYLVDNALQTKFQAETRIALETLSVAGLPSGYTSADKYRFNWPKLVLRSADTGESNESVSEQVQASAEIDTTSGINTSFFVHEIGAI